MKIVVIDDENNQALIQNNVTEEDVQDVFNFLRDKSELQYLNYERDI